MIAGMMAWQRVKEMPIRRMPAHFSQVGKFVLHCPVFFWKSAAYCQKISPAQVSSGNMADEELQSSSCSRLAMWVLRVCWVIWNIGGFGEAALLGGHEKVVHGKKKFI